MVPPRLVRPTGADLFVLYTLTIHETKPRPQLDQQPTCIQQLPPRSSLRAKPTKSR
jgi:hypothetical protein